MWRRFFSVRVTWSWDALGMAAESILALSGMALTVATEGDDVKEVLTPESPDAGNAVCHAAGPEFRRGDWRRMLSEMSATRWESGGLFPAAEFQ
ncbi:hypothetical protein ECZC10_54140 [Escherichia coli]|nr:hypothetical protein ECZC10_54140 [Escherichia coli]